MRPDVLNPLFRPVTSLAGIGPKLAQLLGRLLEAGDDTVPPVVDLLFHLPVSLIDRRLQPGIAKAPAGAIVTLKLRIDRHQPSPRHNRRLPYRVFGHDDTGEIALTFFHADRTWLERTLPVGETRYVSGRMDWFNGRPGMIHPDHMVSEADFAEMPLVEPVYPMTAGLARKTVAKAVADALEGLPDLPEWLDPAFTAAEGLPGFSAALTAAHHPETPAELEPTAAPRRRLAYDELLASQLALAMIRAHARRSAGRPRAGNGQIRDRLTAALPFGLTASQKQAVAEIAEDLAAPERMSRLLQGDVGSGKTVVALFAMAQVVEDGGQAALMAPTEILARQHAATLAPLADAAGLRLALLTGREKAGERNRVLAGLASGDIDIVVGTHALFQAGVEFRDLALAVIDEQHRFGVHQRLALTEKGEAVDILVLTATPIPRTLVLSFFGDMDVSRLTEKPAGRKPIETRAVPLSRIDEVIEGVRRAAEAGQRIYWVCPLVEESDAVDLAAAEARQSALEEALGPIVGLVHGRMKAADKDRAMASFRSGETKVLVATTVIEVGVDVPDATIMVIEHAERFGLAQLHQLRGRVGRGAARSSCLLLYRAPLGEIARQRLKVIRETEDGFRIAEEDLRLRGEGELLGTRQSGTPGFRIADLAFHADLLAAAHDDARMIVANDPDLASERGQALRVLLYLFRRDAAIRLIRAG